MSCICFLFVSFDFGTLHEVTGNGVERSDSLSDYLEWTSPCSYVKLADVTMYQIDHLTWEAVEIRTGPLYEADGSSSSILKLAEMVL